MLKTFITRPSMTIIMILFFMVMGLVSMSNLVIEDNPKIDYPLVNITTFYPGASPEEIETQITKKIEDVVSEISEIKSIKSTSKDSVGSTLVEFNIEADINVKSIEVKDKVEAILNDFPADADAPIIEKFDPLIQPIAELTLSSTSMNETQLWEYADKKLSTKLSSIEGVASVDIYGGRERQINVNLDNNLLIKNFLSIEDVINSIKRKNLNVPGGSIDRQNSKISVRFIGEFQSVKEIKNIEIVSHEGKMFKLKDIATIEDSYKDIESLARVNGESVIGLSIKKLSDGDAVKVVTLLKVEMDKIRPTLPKDTKLELVIDKTDITLKDTYSTAKSLLIGIALCVFILIFFLGDWRGAFISAIVIPTSIVSTFFLMDLSGFSINFMTLLAFGTSLGTLVANALLIIENTSKHLAMGKDPVTAAEDGTQEVLLSVIAGAGTNLVVFTPLAFMGGLVGQFMLQFGMTVVFATLFSILASVTLTPTLCALILKNPDENKSIFRFFSNFLDKILEKSLNFYKFFFDKMNRFPFTSLIISSAFFLTIIFPATRLGFEFIPKSDRSEFLIEITMPDGTPVERTGEASQKIEKELLSYPEVENVLANVGFNGEETARITVDLVDAGDRIKSYKELMDQIFKSISKIPEISFIISGGERSTDGFGDITVNIEGENYSEMIAVSKKMQEIMSNSGYFRTIDNFYKKPKMEIRFTPDANAIINQNLNNVRMGAVIRSLVNGNDDAIYKEGGEEYDINVRLAKEYKTSIEDFDNFLILGKDGLIPISNLGKVEYVVADSPLKRRDKARIIQLNGYLAKGISGAVMTELTEEFKNAQIPNTIKWRFAGKAENSSEAGSELGKAFILAVILTYMLLVAILNSFILPISIASSILTSFLGVFLVMFFLDYSINIASMMAMVMVVGLAVNNAILMVEFTEQKISEGLEVGEALWVSLQNKLKPILMTSLAIVAGTIPQVFEIDKAKASMGGVVIGGILGSVFFTYLMVPAVHRLIYNIKYGAKKFFSGAFSLKEE